MPTHHEEEERDYEAVVCEQGCTCVVCCPVDVWKQHVHFSSSRAVLVKSLFAADMAALPAFAGLTRLNCSDNPAAGARGWVALAGALPSLPALDYIDASDCTGMGSEGAAALAAALPQCPRLQAVWVDGGGLDAQAMAALRAAAARVPRSAERPLGLSIE